MSFGYQVLGFGSGAGAAGYDIEYLIVGGGAAGGKCHGPGAGAGGVLAGTVESLISFALNITVGAGAAVNTGNPAGDGGDSILSGAEISTLTGGGGGGGTDRAGRPTNGNGGANEGAGDGAGFDGGAITSFSPPQYGVGGGGGAAANGQDGTNTYAGDGGVGAITTIMTTTMATDNSVGEVDGSDVYFSGGGGGCGYGSQAGCGVGGKGGGGAGRQASNAGISGTVNTGGGGGGSHLANAGGGGSGCVVLRMPTADYTTTITGSPDVDTDGLFTVLTFTGNGSYTT